MTEYIKKRSGKTVKFNPEKIRIAITKANREVTQSGYSDTISPEGISEITERVISQINSEISVEQIQDLVEKELMAADFYDVAKAYIIYRKKHQERREASLKLMEQYKDILSTEDSDDARENANINAKTTMGTMLRLGTTGAKIFADNYGIPEEFVIAEKEGYTHYHDKDFSFITYNCFMADLTKIFYGGFDNGHGYIREPNSIRSAGAITAVIIQSLQNDQLGGIAVSGLDFSLSEYVRKSWRKILKKQIDQCTYLTGKKILFPIDYDICKFCQPGDPGYDKQRNISLLELETTVGDRALAEKIFLLSVEDIVEETEQSMEALIHNLNSLHSRAGSQTPFSSVNYGMCTTPEGRLVSKSLLKATWNGLGHGETPIFPVQIFQVMPGVNYNPGDPNYDLFKLAMKVSAKRLYPNFNSVGSSFNLPYYKSDDYRTFAATMGK